MLCHWSGGIFNMVNIELFVNINNPSRLHSVVPPRNTTCSCSIYLIEGICRVVRKAFSMEFSSSANRCTADMTWTNVTVRFRTSRSWNFFFKSRLLWEYFLPLWWSGNSWKLTGLTCMCVEGCVGSRATDWYHKWTIGWKGPPAPDERQD